MGIEISPGITIDVVPTQKFKTTQITFRFLTKLTNRNLHQRSLLAAVLENSSYNFRTPKEMNEVLADLYGATFGVDVNRRGNVHEVIFTMNVVGDKFLNSEKSLLTQAFRFLKEIILNPALEGHEFNSVIVSREKHHLKNYIDSLKENKQDQAIIKLQENYFTDEVQKTLIYGDKDEIDKITPEELYHVYQDMIFNDNISVVVVGDTDKIQIANYIENFNFVPRNTKELDYFYRQPKKEHTDIAMAKENITQSKLAMAYNTETYLNDIDYYSLIVFNGLFGGFPHSKLFMNIREKASFAYYASSYINAYRGILIVQSGISSKNKDQVVKLVGEQLEDIILGNFTDEEVEQTKTMLIGGFANRLDYPQALKEQAIIENILGRDYNKEVYSEKIAKVTKDDIKHIAKKVKLQNIYFIEGSE